MWRPLLRSAAWALAIPHIAPDKTALQILSKASSGGAARMGLRMDHAVIDAVLVPHEGALPAPFAFARWPQELDRVLRTATCAEVVHDAGRRIERAPGVGPDVSFLRLARARVQHRHWRLVGLQHTGAEHEALVRVVQRLQRCTSTAGPLRQRRARRLHARACVDRFLPVVRQVIDEAADQRVRHQPRGGHAAVDDLRLHGLFGRRRCSLEDSPCGCLPCNCSS
jgi:hypothetical protein